MNDAILLLVPVGAIVFAVAAYLALRKPNHHDLTKHFHR